MTQAPISAGRLKAIEALAHGPHIRDTSFGVSAQNAISDLLQHIAFLSRPIGGGDVQEAIAEFSRAAEKSDGNAYFTNRLFKAANLLRSLYRDNERLRQLIAEADARMNPGTTPSGK